MIAACSSSPDPTDTPPVDTDTGTGADTSVVVDSTTPEDTGTAEDSATPTDTGAPPADTGSPPTDTGSPPADTGAADTTVMDTTVVDTAVVDTSVVDTGTVDTSVLDTGPDVVISDAMTVDTGPAPTCTDGIKNGVETDTDCGGGSCPKCADTKVCGGPSDCASGVCTTGVCTPAPSSCTDAIKNGTETDVDCGGTCAPCAATKGCLVDQDCAGTYCGSATKVCTYATTCKQLHLIRPTLTSNTYTIDPDGAGGSAAFDAYCDMSSDGGGWTKISHVTGNIAYAASTGAVGNAASPSITGFAKLSDAQINAIGGAASKTYRIQGGLTSKKVYLQSANAYSDPATAFGLMGGSKQVCHATSLASCGFFATTWSTIDTTSWYADGNNCDRYFTDYLGAATCWPSSAGNNRCWKAGVSCSAGGSPDHPYIPSLTMWVRE